MVNFDATLYNSSNESSFYHREVSTTIFIDFVTFKSLWFKLGLKRVMDTHSVTGLTLFTVLSTPILIYITLGILIMCDPQSTLLRLVGGVILYVATCIYIQMSQELETRRPRS